MFGGSFDPPHQTHAALIEAAADQLQLDEVKVIPTGDAWHKTRKLTSAAHRLAMARLAFGHLAHVTVDSRETLRSGPSYSVDTLREIKAENPDAELFLIMGGDQARALPHWHQSEVIRQLAIICVAERADSTGTLPPFYAKSLPNQHLNHPPSHASRVLKMPLSATSASTIRAFVADHQDVVPLVGEPVARYIALHHLYQTA
jgi:nicotinate-nucleotide adenylyltransferase